MSKLVRMLEEINEHPELLKNKYKNNTALALIIRHAFTEEGKFALPEGTPPYKEFTADETLAPTNLMYELRSLYVFQRTDVKPIFIEKKFVELLEALGATEAKILIAIKEQTLHKMYKKITRKALQDAGYL